MTKKDLIRAIAARSHQQHADIEATLDALCAVCAEVLTEGAGAEIALPGVGKLKTSTRAERTASHPQTGELHVVPERLFVKFVPSQALNSALRPSHA